MLISFVLEAALFTNNTALHHDNEFFFIFCGAVITVNLLS